MTSKIRAEITAWTIILGVLAGSTASAAPQGSTGRPALWGFQAGGGFAVQGGRDLTDTEGSRLTIGNMAGPSGSVRGFYELASETAWFTGFDLGIHMHRLSGEAKPVSSVLATSGSKVDITQTFAAFGGHAGWMWRDLISFRGGLEALQSFDSKVAFDGKSADDQSRPLFFHLYLSATRNFHSLKTPGFGAEFQTGILTNSRPLVGTFEFLVRWTHD